MFEQLQHALPAIRRWPFGQRPVRRIARSQIRVPGPSRVFL